MKYKYAFNERIQRLDIKAKKKTVSTLRVLVSLNSTLKKEMKRYGNLTKYLAVLIKRYRFLFYMNYFEPSENPKTQYQKRGQAYVTQIFRSKAHEIIMLSLG